jgi:hypothetical protein
MGVTGWSRGLLIVIVALRCTTAASAAFPPFGRIYGHACESSADALLDLEGVPHSYTYAPAIPTERDSISLLVADYLPGGDYAVDDYLVSESNDTVNVTVRVADKGKMGADVIIPWKFQTCLSPRPAGTVTTILMNVSRETLGVGIAAWRESFEIAIEPLRASAPLDMLWTFGNTMSDCLGGVAVDQQKQISIVPNAGWTGEPTTLWCSSNPRAVRVSPGRAVAGCSSVLSIADGTHSLAITCDSWLIGAPVANLDVVVLSGFAGWTDVRVDSLQIGTAMIRSGNTARLTYIAIEEGLAMDFNRDARVDLADFFVFADAYGSNSFWFDFDRSGQVDIGDFYIFADSFGRSR